MNFSLLLRFHQSEKYSVNEKCKLNKYPGDQNLILWANKDFFLQSRKCPLIDPIKKSDLIFLLFFLRSDPPNSLQENFI